MKFSIYLTAAGLVAGASAAPKPQPKQKYMENDKLADMGMENLKEYIAENGYPSNGSCTMETAAVRKEWASLSRDEKLDYITAVQCLGSKPARTPSSIARGAKSRYDDLVVTHIQQSNQIHGTANFLTWHRYFTWVFEQMLRNECGYAGYQPYYNWAHWAHDPKSSPFLDGSDTSMSGDGAYIPGRNYSCFPYEEPCLMKLFPGTGGGCVTSGPFKNWKTNLGPLQSMLKLPPSSNDTVPPNPSPDGLGYNPRCLRRDISLQSANATTDTEVSALIKNYNDIATFQRVYQGEFAQGRMGVHTGGHYTIGGDAGSDFYNSPADPAFFPHHGMVDRVWWTWQNLDLGNRLWAIAGTTEIGGGGRNGTLGDVITLGEWVGVGDVRIGDAVSTLAGPFCYIYQ